jgi:N-acetylglucosaminyldiphosphoundecaprenol N-acetyl-beta-D-mannosaminyltransferase
LVAELGVNEDVDLPGFRANPYALMRQAAVLALSSRAEGFGNVLIEAMASGTPVVSTNCPGGPPELLMHGRYGRLVPVGDASALAEAIEATLDSPPDPELLRQRAHQFSVERSVQQYYALVDAVVEQPASPATTLPDVPAPVRVLGVQIHPITLAQLLALLPVARTQQRRLIIAYANVYALNLAYRLAWFRAVLNHSDVVFCDGFGAKLGAKLLGHDLPQRFTPPDWLDQLVTLASVQGWSLFLLGARPGVALRAANCLRDQAPGLHIVGVHHGYFDKTPGSSENEAVIRYINAVKPDILLIGFGMPLQERWLHDNWEHIAVQVALPVGAALDYVAGEMRRGPRWMTDNGLEWLARLLIEPRRLWRRYLWGNPLFFWRILRQRWRQC